jgi:hypothetical protein
LQRSATGALQKRNSIFSEQQLLKSERGFSLTESAMRIASLPHFGPIEHVAFHFPVNASQSENSRKSKAAKVFSLPFKEDKEVLQVAQYRKGTAQISPSPTGGGNDLRRDRIGK